MIIFNTQHITSLAINHLDSQMSPTIDLQTFLSTIQSLDSKGGLRQAIATTSPGSAVAPTTPSPSTTSSVSLIISGLLTAFGNTLSPILGPLAPITTIVGPLINNALTGLFTTGLNHIGGILRRSDFPDDDFQTFFLNIPSQGSFMLSIPKHQQEASSQSDFPQQHEINYNINNLFQLAQKMQQQQKHIPLSHPQAADEVKYQHFPNELMMMPLTRMLSTLR